MQKNVVHTSFDHFNWNMLKLFRSPKNWILDVYILLCLLVCGSSQVAHGLCEVPSMKVLTRGMMKEHWWGSMTWVSSWPFIPCYAGHRPLVTKLTHVLVLAMSCCRDPVRFSLIVRSPMVQTLLCSAPLHTGRRRNFYGFLAGQTLLLTQPTGHWKGTSDSTGQRIWAFWCHFWCILWFKHSSGIVCSTWITWHRCGTFGDNKPFIVSSYTLIVNRTEAM